jgi:N,N-dimethylformamidase
VLFHADMVEGGDWEPSLKLEIDSEWRSGVYALKIYDGTDEDWIPFYVRPAPGKESKVLFLAPTNTYLAYGNETNSTADIGGDLQLMKTGEVEPQDADKYVTEHPELGLSIYDNHEDGAGVAYASRLRPMLNFRPFHFNWLNSAYRHFASDFYLLDWLEHFGFGYDVLTDEDLHLEGISSLSEYEVVITGSHPEYYSERMLDTVQEYVDDGGKLMYLGGNGFYWATSFHPDMPHVIEVRRGHTGARNWTSPPGETVHAFTGEQGGLWRNKGRGPHPLTGIGMGAVGWGKAGSYKPIENVPLEQQWILEGVKDDLIGTEGMLLGGAAGDEIDHTDYLYGTPSETQVVASTVGLSEHFQPVIEYYTNVLPGQGGSQNPLVRADMTWLPKKNGGAVFSVGSICWTGCLPINDYDNSASRVTLNVLNNFVGNL